MNKFKLSNIKEETTVIKSIRIKLSTLEKIENLAKVSNLPVNRLLNECIEFALINLDEEDLKKIHK